MASDLFTTRSFRAPNLLPEDIRPPEHVPEPPERGQRRRLLSVFFIILIVILTSCTTLIARSNNNFFVGVKHGFLIRQITHIFTPSRNELAGEREDRVNFLLLGIGGPGHEGPYLTDTVILASYQPSTDKAAMLSIPRDLIVPKGDGTYLKVNHIYAINQRYGIERAFSETKRIIGSTFGLPIHYLGVVDFDGFIKLIDLMGGVEVTVEKGFTDTQFPAGPNQYQNVSFKAGAQVMDGSKALMFARSRHGTNGEGSDFARSRRQQKIILATKRKVSSFDTLFNPRKITTLYNLANEYTKTDMEPWEMVKLIQMSKDLNPTSIATFVLDDGPNGYLTSGISSIDRAYILQPKAGNYQELQLLVQTMLEGRGFHQENPRIVIQNGTLTPNLALIVGQGLEYVGVQPLATGNASEQNHLKTTLYDYTDGKKPSTRAFLESRFNTVAQTNIPLNLVPYTLAKEMNVSGESGGYQTIDFLLILGEDATTSQQREIVRTLTLEELTTTTTATSTEPTTEPANDTDVQGGDNETS